MRCSDMRSSSGYTATVLAPSSYAARNARTAISARFATRTLENIEFPSTVALSCQVSIGGTARSVAVGQVCPTPASAGAEYYLAGQLRGVGTLRPADG